MAGSLPPGTTAPRGLPSPDQIRWPLVPSRDLFELRYGKALVESLRRPGVIPVYGTNGRCGSHDEALFRGPGVILGRKGQGPLGVEWCSEDYWVIDTAYSLILRRPEVDLKYAYFLIKHIGLNHLKDGTSNPTLSRDSFGAQALPLPPIDIQRAIAHILGTLDDKIELNRRMSETLEAMTRALFKSWFVDFDPVRAKMERRDPGLPRRIADLFPDRLIDSELGEIPEGWEVGRLGDLCDVEKGLSYKGEGVVDDGGLPMVNLGCFGGGGAFKAENIKRYCGDFKERHLARPGDLLVANTDMTQNRIILGSPALLPKVDGEGQFLFTHHTFAFRFRRGGEIWRRYIYFTLLQPGFREVAEGFATGTTVLALPRDGLLNLTLSIPPDRPLRAFERHVEDLLTAADVRRRQSQTVAAARDALLPKLISGELRAQVTNGRLLGRTA